MRTHRLAVCATTIMLAFIGAVPALGAIALGDAAIIGMQSASPDEFSIVMLNDIASGEEFYVGDINFTNSTTPIQGPPWEVTTTASITAGTVLTFLDNGSSWTAPAGTTMSFVSTGAYSSGVQNASISGSDGVFLWDSTDGAQTVGASTNLFYVKNTDPFGNVYPAGISDGNGGVDRGTNANFRYSSAAPHTGTPAQLFAAISNASNWEVHASASGATWSGTGFTVVPEPGAWMFMSLIGIALAGFKIVRRKKSGASS